MKLTFRDKVILAIFLGVVILIAGFFALIKPKSALIKDDKEKLEKAEEKKDDAERRIALKEPLIEDIKELVKKTNEQGNIFIPRVDIDSSTSLDKYMQHFANDNNMKITELKVDAIATSALNYYYRPYSEVATALRESADINGDLLKKVEEDSKESTLIGDRRVETVMSTRYGFSATGSKKDAWAFLDAISQSGQAMIITDFSYNINVEEDKARAEAAGEAYEEEDEDAQYRYITEDTIVDCDFVIMLYSIYDMPELTFKK